MEVSSEDALLVCVLHKSLFDVRSGKSLTRNMVAWEVVMMPFLHSSTVSRQAWTVSDWEIYPGQVEIDPVLGLVG